MVRLFGIIFCFCIAAFYGCVSANNSSHASGHEYTTGKITEIIKPSGMHEDCIELLPGQILDYYFESSNNVIFNIHYHEDSEMIYPVTIDNTSIEKGSFHPQKKQYYCLMWINPHHESISISYSYKIRKEQK